VIAGIAGDEITSTEVGDILGMEVYYNKKAIANILSWLKATETMTKEWNQDKNIFTATTDNDEQFVFECVDGGLYACDFIDLNVKVTMLTTVEDNLLDYTKEKYKLLRKLESLAEN